VVERNALHQQIQSHYEAVWRSGDAWGLENSAFDQTRYARQIALLEGRNYERALEIGCGSGCFTRMLAGIVDQVVALDIAAAAIERARSQTAGTAPGRVDLRVANIMDFDLNADGPWDLIVFSEAIYCLIWLYPMFDVAWLAARLFEATRDHGRLLLVNTYGQEKDWLLRPWLIDTYRDLFRNVGFRLEAEEILRGTKEDTEMRVLMSLFEKVAC
jgi:SAM-dependent methyltransferase